MPLGAEKYQNGWREGIQENSQDKKGTGKKQKDENEKDQRIKSHTTAIHHPFAT